MEIISTTTYPLTYNKSGFPYTDEYYTDDQTIINTAVNGTYPLRHIKITPEYGSGWVWLASRFFVGTSSATHSYVRTLDSNGSYSRGYLYYSDSNPSSVTHSTSNGVRSVISLKSDIKIVGGDGTSANPYVISN